MSSPACDVGSAPASSLALALADAESANNRRILTVGGHSRSRRRECTGASCVRPTRCMSTHGVQQACACACGGRGSAVTWVALLPAGLEALPGSLWRVLVAPARCHGAVDDGADRRRRPIHPHHLAHAELQWQGVIGAVPASQVKSRTWRRLDTLTSGQTGVQVIMMATDGTRRQRRRWGGRGGLPCQVTADGHAA